MGPGPPTRSTRPSSGSTFAQNFSDRFSAGLTAKYVDDRLGTVSGSAFAVDFGTNFHATLNNHPVKFSFVLANLGSNLTYEGTGLQQGQVPREPLPGEDPVPDAAAAGQPVDQGLPAAHHVPGGAGVRLIAGENNRLTVLGDFNQPNNNTPGFAFGSEWQSNQHRRHQLRVRAAGELQLHRGQRSGPGGAGDGAERRGEAAGAGLRRRADVRDRNGGFGLGLDYAYKYLGVLGATNFFSFTLGW